MSTSFATILRDLAARRPDAPALTCGDVTWTFRDLDTRSSQTAQALIADGVRPGDRVGVLSRNCAEFYELIYACSKAGAILVGLNWRLSSYEIEAIVADAAPTVIVTGASGEGDLLSQPVRGAKSLKRIVSIGDAYEAWRAGAPKADTGHAGAADDVAMLLYTSGTTGLPKGAMLTNRGMCYSRRLGEAWGMTADSVNLVAMPLFHIGGSGYGSSTMLLGGHTVLMKDVNLPLIATTIEQHKVTHAFFVPTVLQALIDVPGIEAMDLASMKLLMYGASPISETLLRNALQVLSCDFIQAYGMTETSGTVVTLEPVYHRLDGTSTERLRSCGRALPFAEIRITNTVTGNEVPRGDVGEIWVRSEMVMKGYWNNQRATEEAITKDGWLRTGDAAYQDADGFIYLYDRYKDLIISGGENIYPAEVENALLAHPGVSECALIGIPHPRWGEAPRAIVVPRAGHAPTEAELIAFARTRLAHYKCPTSVVLAETLPRNASGKLLKRELRKVYMPPG